MKYSAFLRSENLVFRYLLLSISIIFSQSSYSAQWELGSGVRSNIVSTVYSEGTADRPVTFSLLPYLEILKDGQKYDVNIRGSLDYINFVDKNETSISPALSIDGTAIVAERFAWIDTQFRTNLAVVDNSNTVNADLVDLESYTRLHQARIAPVLVSTLDDSVVIGSELAFAFVDSPDDETVQSRTYTSSSEVQFYLGRSKDWFNIINVDFQSTSLFSNTAVRDYSASISSIYTILPTLKGQIILGYGGTDFNLDDNDIESALNDDLEGSSYWGLGLEYRPDTRITLTTKYVERASGGQPFVSMDVVGRQTNLKLSWTRELAFTKDSNFSEDTFLSTSAEGDLDNLAHESNDVTLSPVLADFESIDEKVNLYIERVGRLSLVAVNAKHSSRESRLSENRVERNELSFIYNRKITKTLRMDGAITFDETVSWDTGVEDVVEGSRIMLGIVWSN